MYFFAFQEYFSLNDSLTTANQVQLASGNSEYFNVSSGGNRAWLYEQCNFYILNFKIGILQAISAADFDTEIIIVKDLPFTWQYNFEFQGCTNNGDTIYFVCNQGTNYITYRRTAALSSGGIIYANAVVPHPFYAS